MLYERSQAYVQEQKMSLPHEFIPGIPNHVPPVGSTHFKKNGESTRGRGASPLWCPIFATSLTRKTGRGTNTALLCRTRVAGAWEVWNSIRPYSMWGCKGLKETEGSRE